MATSSAASQRDSQQDQPEIPSSANIADAEKAAEAPKSKGRRIRGLEPEERRQLRRRALIDSALELFSSQGYAHTTIEQICQNAYVGYKGFYDEFETKEQLFVTLYEILTQRMSTAVTEELSESSPSRQELLRILLSTFIKKLLEDRRVAQVLFIEAAGISPNVEASRRVSHNGYAAFLERTYIEGLYQPPIDVPEGAVNTRRISLAMVGAIAEVIVDWLVDPEADEIEKLVNDLEQFCRVVLAGLAVGQEPQQPAPA